MITFRKENDLLLLVYTTDQGDNKWIYDEFKTDNTITLKNTFTFREIDIYSQNEGDEESFDFYDSTEFIIARLELDYFKIENEVLNLNYLLFLHKDINISSIHFVAERNTSIFRVINKLVKEDIYIGGNNTNAIPENEFNKLINEFPKYYELRKYVEARLSTILRNYLNTAIDGEAKYNIYMNKKVSEKGGNLTNLFRENELMKFITILDQLKKMLENEINISEVQWQKEILQILLLVYPKYIYIFHEVKIRDTYNEKYRRLDYLLIDSSGNTDIIEIKKPFKNSIVSKNLYRDNYIPLRELSGTVMQIEKYIFYLNKWGKKGEEKLTNTYKSKLSEGFNIKITNPKGIIIMGRENELSEDQLQDFEVIKRKYNNIIDIITYDELLRRLEFTIAQLNNSQTN